MQKKLTDHQRNTLRDLEPALREACRMCDLERSEELMKRIQVAFGEQRSHFRLLKAKLWYYEALLDSGKTSLAESGFEGIKKLSNEGTRLYLEVMSFLAVCALRQKKIDSAKKYVRYVIKSMNSITSDSRRHQFQSRLVNRIEDECILSQLIGQDQGRLDVDDIHQRSIVLV